MEYVSDVQDAAKQLAHDPADIYDTAYNQRHEEQAASPFYEELIKEPDMPIEPLQEAAARPPSSSSSTSPPPSTSEPCDSRSSSVNSDKSTSKLKKRWSQERFCEIVNWVDIRESSIVMISLMSFIILLMKYPVLYLISNILLITATGAFFVKIYAKVMSLIKGGDYEDPFRNYITRDSFITEGQVQKYLIKFSRCMFPALQDLQHLIFGTDLKRSTCFWVKLYFLSHITSWFTGLTVLLWSVILAFSLPIIYQKNKVLIDANLAVVSKIYEETSEKVIKTVTGVLPKFKSD